MADDWPTLQEADNFQIGLANLFGDAAAASTFQRYRDFAIYMQTPHVQRGETMGFNTWPSDLAETVTRNAYGRWTRFAYEGQWGEWKTQPAALIDTVHKGGCKALATVMGVPGTTARRLPANDSERAAYADYALAQADAGADLIELWNEQNGETFTNGNPDPLLYALASVAAYQRVKAQHPNLPVITGGTTPHSAPHDPRAWDWLCKAATAEYAHCRDGLAHHPYDWSGKSPLSDPIAWNSFAQTVNLHTDNPGTDIYVTEVGSPSGGGVTSAGETYTVDRQARWFDLYNAGMDAWPFVPKLVIWHCLFDGGRGIGTAVEPFFGHFTQTGADKIDPNTQANVSAKYRARAQQLIIV